MTKFHRKYYPNSDKYYMTAEYFDNYIYTDYAPFSTTGRQVNPSQQVFKKELEENITIAERATTEYQDRTYDQSGRGSTAYNYSRRGERKAPELPEEPEREHLRNKAHSCVHYFMGNLAQISLDKDPSCLYCGITNIQYRRYTQ